MNRWLKLAENICKPYNWGKNYRATLLNYKKESSADSHKVLDGCSSSFTLNEWTQTQHPSNDKTIETDDG